MLNNNLYTIAAEYKTIIENLVTEDGEFSEEKARDLTHLEGALTKKMQGVGAYIKNLYALERGLAEMAENVRYRQQKISRAIERLEKYLLENMVNTGITAINGAEFDIKLKSCPPSVDVYDECAIPDDLMMTKVTRRPDKDAIKKRIKEGEVIPGADLITDKKRIEIK